MKSTSTLQIILCISLLLLACLPSTLPSFSTSTPSPTLASIPAAPTLSISVPATSPPVQPESDLEGENLLVTIPPGFKIDYEAEQDNTIINEMTPENESVNDWETLVTALMFLGDQNIALEAFQQKMTQSWFDFCQNSETHPVADGVENGYAFALWMLYCPLNPDTQKMEYVYVKAIRGNDSFYNVQVAFRYKPSDEVVTYWMQYLKGVIVCDTRIAERACP
ncbi:MAG: hypothetical protein IT310_15370 [Anaerolineales bacterium]|nr:hypothetical protein [Anaerolineales bacterium]